MKRLISIALALVMLLACLPAVSLAKAKQMKDGVPVWTEETVKQYMLDYIDGKDLEKLFGYYDLQVRRYMPMATYTSFLSDIDFLTGAFQGFGAYRSFEEPAQKTKTHVLHLCMEKQDLDLYFTHKNKEDDWEVMAVEFALADEQDCIEQYVVTSDAPEYTEQEITVGDEPYALSGTLTLPSGASAETPVPAVVLVQGSGPSDRDESVGKLKLFADIAHSFARNGIATLRYDKRTYVYGASMTQDEIAALTVEEETIQDAISAGKLLTQQETVDPDRIVLLGHSMGAMLAPRIVSESNGVFKAMVLVAGTPKTLLEVMLAQSEEAVAALEDSQREAAQPQLDEMKSQIAALPGMTADEAKAATIAGVNAYYFWEMQQYDACELIRRLKVPTYIVQGTADWQVRDGVEAYEDILGSKLEYVDYHTYPGLNHFLMEYTGPAEAQGTVAEYDTEATLDAQTAMDLVNWVLHMGQTDDKGE